MCYNVFCAFVRVYKIQERTCHKLKNDLLYYSVGALLYCPANKKTIADSIISERFGTKFSLALCLEDTIGDRFVPEAEHALIDSIDKICRSRQTRSFYLPKIFIRVRDAGQILPLTKALGKGLEVVTGYIVPKFTLSNAEGYVQALIRANELSPSPLYLMPIYEDPSILDLRTRQELLYRLKDILAKAGKHVLNIRVGGNDLCHAFGLRRHPDESIHEIGPVSHILSDIITVYGMDYVVSGPVWEYYSGPGWEKGLRQEIRGDKLCGFIGKTVIHPSQISVVNEAYRVSRKDFDDARAILGWSPDSDALVSGSVSGERMNEYKTHGSWARQTLCLAEVFGVED